MYILLNSAKHYLKTEKEHNIMSNSKDTSSKKQGKSSVSENNMSNKNVTHTQNLPPKTTSNKAPSSGNIKGI